MRIVALRIVIAVVWLTAFIFLRFTAASNVTLSISSRKTREHTTKGHNSHWMTAREEYKTWPFTLTYREIQNVLRRESGEEGTPVDCCPIIEEITEPTGGRNRQEMYVELYRDSENEQRFYEYSCRPDVLDKPCRFIDKKIMNQTRCVQKFSYSYAMVKYSSKKLHQSEIDKLEHRHRHKDHHFPDLRSGSPWTLDHIRVRSGCSCEVYPKLKKKKNVTLKTKKVKSKMKKKNREPDTI